MFDKKPINYADKVMQGEDTWKTKLVNYVKAKYKPNKNFKKLIFNFVNF